MFPSADFSLRSWLDSKGLPRGEDLTPSDARQLEAVVGLTDHLQEQCNRTEAVYQSKDNNGWNNG